MTKQLKCGKKNSYASRAEANRVLFLQIKNEPKLRIYHCPDCRKWHLTKQPKEKQ